MSVPSTEPVVQRFEVAWEVRVTPDEDSRQLGFEAYRDDYAFLKSINSAALTGSGCVSYGFDTGTLFWTILSNHSTFEAVKTRHKGRSYGESVTLKWRGKLVEDKLSGELLVTTGGNPVEPKDVQKELDAEREKVVRERGGYSSKGVMINKERLDQEVAFQQNKLQSKRGQGRTIRYHFESIRTKILPVGFATTQPTTQPSR